MLRHQNSTLQLMLGISVNAIKQIQLKNKRELYFARWHEPFTKKSLILIPL